jgi:enamine deaminase RidA (YjgF/YER057c/UK114 family)
MLQAKSLLNTFSRRFSQSIVRPGAVSTSASASSATGTRCIHIEKRIEELNIVLPTPSSPKANYNIICHTTGNIMYVSGHLPIMADGTLLTGRVGPDSGGNSVEEGYEAARHCGLNIISTLKSQLGDLDRVEQIVKVREYLELYI